MHVLPTHIICHINRFVHQCTGTGSFLLSVSVAANSGWKKIGIFNKKSLSVMTYFHPSNLAWKVAGRAVRPLIKLASWRSSVVGEGGGLLRKAGQSDTISNLKDQSGAENRQGETGRAPITICVRDKWQIWATCRRLVQIMIWHFGLNAVPISRRSVYCLCHVHLRHYFLFSPQLALCRADNRIQSGPPGPVLPLVVLLDVCFPVCEVSSQTVW